NGDAHDFGGNGDACHPTGDARTRGENRAGRSSGGERASAIAHEEKNGVRPHFSGVRRHVPALRLGLRLVKGLKAAAAQRIVAARAVRPVATVADLAERAALDRRDLDALARAGALASLCGHRRQAAWQVGGVEKSLPLLDAATVRETPAVLPAPSEAQDIVA